MINNQELFESRKYICDKNQKWMKNCKDSQHNPPTHLCIPNGQSYTHKCPSCGYTITLTGSNYTWQICVG